MHSNVRRGGIWFAVAALALSVSACGGSPKTVEEIPPPPASEAAQQENVVEEESNSEAAPNEDCILAFVGVPFMVPGLQMRAEEGPLTEEHVGEVFEHLTPMEENMPADLQAAYAIFHDAALGAVGLEGPGVKARMDEPDVLAAVKDLGNIMNTVDVCS